MTLIGHAALGATAYGALRPHETTTRWGLSRRALLLLCLLLPMLPDLDAVMHIWVKYGHPLGHRGISHSIFFALFFCLGLSWLLQRLGYAERGRRVLGRMTLAFTLIMATHGLTDAMTTGGKPPRLLWPVVPEGKFLPKRFIPVSPMGKQLLRTKWRSKSLPKLARKRARVLRGNKPNYALVREAVSWSERPDHYRRLVVVGIALTEIVLLSPFALGVIIFNVWRRRRYGPSAKEPPRTRPPPEAPPEGSAPNLWPPGIAVGVTLVATVVVGVLLHRHDGDITISKGHLDDEYSTFYRRVAPVEGGEDAPVAVMLHGWRCSHQMMMPMSRALARSGVEVWNIDMPGHGRAPIPLDAGCKPRDPDKEKARRNKGLGANCRFSTGRLFMDATTAALQHLNQNQLAGRDVFVIGHSTGAVVAHELRGEVGDQLAGRVVIEGRFRRLRPEGNRLIVGKRRYLEQRRAGHELDVTHGSFEAGTARELFTANRSHLDLIYDERVNDRILRWISSVTKKPLGEATRHYRKLSIAWALVLSAFGLALSTFAARYASLRGWLPPVRPAGYPRPGVAFACIVFGSLAASLWAGELFLAGGTPWLQARINQVLPTYMMCASVCIGVPYVLLSRRPGRPDPRSLALDAALAVIVFLAIYLTLGLAVDRHFFHVGITAWRLPRLLTWALAFLPITLVVHEIGLERDSWWARILTLILQLMAWAALFWVVAAGRSSTQVGDSMRFVGVIAFAELWSLCVGWRRRSRLFAALVSSLVLAWIWSTVYPILSGGP